MIMKSFHTRMAEICTVNKTRELRHDEIEELDHCLQQNANYIWEMLRLKNLSLMASMINDTEWQHELCREIDELADDPHASKIKKP
ncbi:DUF7667 family protein [Paenibacillus cellulosilyticus]